MPNKRATVEDRLIVLGCFASAPELVPRVPCSIGYARSVLRGLAEGGLAEVRVVSRKGRSVSEYRSRQRVLFRT